MADEPTLITIGDPPPVPQAWFYDVPADNSEYVEKGQVEHKEGADFYLTGEGGEVGVIVMPDYWGFNGGRIRSIADHLAQSTNAMVAIPMLLGEPCLQGGTDGDGAPPGFDPDANPVELKKWLMLYLWENYEVKIKTVAQHLRQQGAKRIGGVGFGFGAWVTCYTSVLCKDMVGAVLASPLACEIEEMNGGDPYVMATRMGCPALIMHTPTDRKCYHLHGDIYETIKERHDTCDVESFDKMAHGWLLRGDASTASVREGIADGVMALQKYLRHRMWPLPLGADSDTLRQACQDGDADRVEELIKLQLPVGGKDAYDVCGMSPIHYAARFGNIQPIKLLVAAEADVNAMGGAMNETALHCSAMHGRNKASAALVQLKAELDALDLGEQTPLHHASLKGHLGVCKILLNLHADIEMQDTAGQTPLHLAAWTARKDIVKYFIGLECSISTEDLRGQLPFDRAFGAGAMECSDQLDLERVRREEMEREKEAAAEAAKKDAAGKKQSTRKSGGFKALGSMVQVAQMLEAGAKK